MDCISSLKTVDDTRKYIRLSLASGKDIQSIRKSVFGCACSYGNWGVAEYIISMIQSLKELSEFFPSKYAQYFLEKRQDVLIQRSIIRIQKAFLKRQRPVNDRLIMPLNWIIYHSNTGAY